MHPRFLIAAAALDEKLRTLLACEPKVFGELPGTMPLSGVYLFTEDGRHMYIGRANRFRARYFLHCRSGSRQNQASFAYWLAREAMGMGRTPHMPGAATRAGLAAKRDFAIVFAGAKFRIRAMAYRHVEETDQTRQALLEDYCAIVLETPYNDFGTH